MDFEKVLTFLIDDFETDQIRYALIGGFAIAVHGIVRATMDIDFLVNRSDLEKIDVIMKNHGYRCFHKTENVSQYVAEDTALGEVDFLHAFRERAITMLEKSQKLPIFLGKNNINTARPEDIIGLKIQAFFNDSEREYREMEDIKMLLETFTGKLDWNVLEDYFRLFGKDELLKTLRDRYGD